MREIKFRAWESKLPYMHDDVFIDGSGNVFTSAGKTFNTPNTEIERSDDLIVMQFTGLKDSNGADIYEGDIVETSFFEDYDNECQFVESGEICAGVVERHASGTWLAVDDRDGVWLSLYHASDYAHTKIIGNIHENPDLIEVSK